MSLIQIITYGIHNNLMSQSLSHSHSFDLIEFSMEKKNDNVGCYYEFIDTNFAHLCMPTGIIIELYDEVLTNIYLKEKIANLILKSKLKIYAKNKFYDKLNKKLLDQTIFIGSIPLYLADFKYIKNKIIVKLPNNFIFLHNFVLNHIDQIFKLEISNDINININVKANTDAELTNNFVNLIKKIDFQLISKMMTNSEHRILYQCSLYFFHNQIQYCSNLIKSSNVLFQNNNIVKIKINKIEKIRGFFLLIPIDLDDYINKIIFNLKNLNMTKTIYFNFDLILNLNSNLNSNQDSITNIKNENIFIKTFKEINSFNVYWIGIDILDTNPCDHKSNNCVHCMTDPNDYIDIFFNSNLVDLPDLANLVNKISLDMVIANCVVGSGHNLMLKLVNGQINKNLELDWFDNQNLDTNKKLIKVIMSFKQIFIKKNEDNIESFIKKNKDLSQLAIKYINMFQQSI